MSIILGLDPGTTTLWYAFLQSRGRGEAHILDVGVIDTSGQSSQAQKFLALAEDMETLLDRYRPGCAGVERLFFSKNQTTGIAVAEARGVVCYLLARRGIPTIEYTPSELKRALCGNGRAPKIQMQRALMKILHLPELPTPDDAADALALAYVAGLSNRTGEGIA